MSDADLRRSVQIVLEGEGHQVIHARDLEHASSILESGPEPDLVFIEFDKSRPEDVQKYKDLTRFVAEDRIYSIVGLGDQLFCDEARAAGVVHFLTKPVTRRDLESILNESLSSAQSPFRRENASCPVPEPGSGKCHVEELGDNRFFLAASPSMLEIYRQVLLLAQVDVTVLILGESGTGKEVIAHLIHKHSKRGRQRFMNVNCAALPSELLESELFGHQMGAFTGAVKDKPGKFELANKGTLLLDEIGEISAQMQAKLLHVLQDGQFTRLGGQQSTRVDVRILAATNIHIESALEEKTFREDLYYRLNAFTITVPPLRKRREEIPYLIEETVRRTPAEMKSSFDRFSDRLMDAAMQYEWKGNLRELRNFVTRTIIMQDEEGGIRELETKIEASGKLNRQEQKSIGVNLRTGMRSIVRDVKDRTEIRMIQDALLASGWNRRHAAQNLNISYRALLYKIQQHHLVPGMEEA